MRKRLRRRIRTLIATSKADREAFVQEKTAGAGANESVEEAGKPWVSANCPKEQFPGYFQIVEKRNRLSRWAAKGVSRVTHPKYGSVVVPHASSLSAILCAAVVWGRAPMELKGAEVWAAGPGAVPVEMP